RLRPRVRPGRSGQRGAFSVARPVRGLAWVHFPKLDGRLGGFFFASHAAHGYGTRLRFCSACCPDCRLRSFPWDLVSSPWVGAWVAGGDADSLHAANGRGFSLELSLAPPGPYSAGPLRCRVAAVSC